ncbi:GNAT family N-acetyltransferase [Lutispora saccharofermentans]|uniref:N-acetyltransferase n=1 Tax=Lutispora saccharofermentans TaxID=3024236 RepID=A0ABT1NGN2_9FIRM|nr:N-acetyltransferase [Lutispora saccharofermentans]
MIIDHTYVSDELAGQGVGKLLLKELVDWIRKENKKIIPLCPYAKAQMEKNKEYHDTIYLWQYGRSFKTEKQYSVLKGRPIS